MKQMGIKVYSKKLHNLFNAPTCFGCKLQPSSGSYKCRSPVQRDTYVVKNEWQNQVNNRNNR